MPTAHDSITASNIERSRSRSKRRAELGERVGEQAGEVAVGAGCGDALDHLVDDRVLAGREESVDLVAVEFDTRCHGPWPELRLDVGDREFAALGAMPRMISADPRSEQHLVHDVLVDAVRRGDLADLVADRGDQHPAEVEDDGA